MVFILCLSSSVSGTGFLSTAGLGSATLASASAAFLASFKASVVSVLLAFISAFLLSGSALLSGDGRNFEISMSNRLIRVSTAIMVSSDG